MKNIIFLGGKELGSDCLNFLIENSNKLDIRVVAALTNDRKILSNKITSVRDICSRFSIPVLESPDNFLGYNDIDMLVSVQYHQILRKKHIEKAREIAVNLHMAPLPEYRGCNQFSYAIIDQAKEFGTTIHRLEAKIDAGDILFEKRFEVPELSDISWLYQKTLKESSLLFKEHFQSIVLGEYSLTSQRSFLNYRNTSFHLRREIEDLKKIDLSWDKEKILRYFRATYFPPFEPPSAIQDGKKVLLTPEWIEQNLG